jgi:hypothetical protein
MVTRNPNWFLEILWQMIDYARRKILSNWFLEILWQMIDYARRKILSPLKRPTLDRLYC